VTASEIGVLERLEDLVPLGALRRPSRDLDVDPEGLGACRDRHANPDDPLLREAHGGADDGRERLDDACRVDEELGHSPLDLSHHLHVGRHGELAGALDGGHQYVAHHRPLGRDPELPRLDPRGVEDRLDQRQELTPSLLDDGEALLLSGREGAPRDELCESKDGVEGSLEVVAHRSEEAAAHALRPRAGLDGRLLSRRELAKDVAERVDAFHEGGDRSEARLPPDARAANDISRAHLAHRPRGEPDVARTWYSVAPGAWSYGLPEIHAPEGKLIANPGCYATAALLALAPIAGAIDSEHVVVDAKSGVSGAGRELKASSHAGFVLENLSPYAVGAHRHAPEIAQMLGFPVCFVPHLLPVRRGLLATCYVHADGDVRALLEDAYAGSSVVRVLPAGVAPEIARVQGTDAAEIAVFEDGSTGTTIVVSALDNLGKGAAGQALQNANLALGLEETAGLRLAGVLV